MVEDPLATADCLQITREVGFDQLLTGRGGKPYTTSCPLPFQADSVKTARDVTRSTLRGWGLHDLSDDAALVVSELVTNAVRYAMRSSGRREIELLLMRVSPHVLLAVADPSDEVPRRKEPDFISENGRGLYIVETYSQSWGWDRLARGGKAVWALFRTEP
ncbi:ATP-binding protein [Nonomuraea wenchangensis]|uniref:Anti-sigma regulatory factor (Ser/Thr protein kinase) n=1 Tax=Nonomuraea wenchangensis TaxID=568860 RepID=A0A1I0LTP1_9ACTN|nr:MULTISPECIES: ATP-binding protein [Nonomuraea]MED7930910.1 ATP-binding protein [Nonomuraea sp. LP-02]SEU46151.1 Anti-sigma regulatory factor (Ser/Thr protein kinase) [Nonomuraea wenchangensis]